jgi:YegS/Rv2252/BmrU family lipid kinase
LASTRVAVIINPISGTGGRLHVARDRAELAASLIAGRGYESQIFITERPGHGRELASAALAQGASLVLAWGGDGTVNEVGSALAFRDASMAIVPSGSGNGLARELRIPFDPVSAIDVALRGRERRIDAGELDGRLFFNVAGIGLDARVAHRFAADGLVHRGFRRYATITVREFFTYKPDYHTIVTDGRTLHARTLLIAIANARQYGNGALIAPEAQLDDGRLDVVVVLARSPLAALVQVPRVFSGRIAMVPGVTMSSAVDIQVTSGQPVLYHVDGEPYTGAAVVAARPWPAALRVIVPVGARPS